MLGLSRYVHLNPVRVGDLKEGTVKSVMKDMKMASVNQPVCE